MWLAFWVLWTQLIYVSGWPQFDKTLVELRHLYSKVLPHQLPTSSKTDNETSKINGLERASRYLLDSINPKVDPCVDFYEHACGGWKLKNKIPDSQSSISNYFLMQKRVFSQIQDSLSQSNSTDIKSSAVQKARLAYKACLDQEQLNKVGTSELRKELKRLGGWPLIDLEGNETVISDMTTFILAVYKERAKESLVSVSKTVNPSNSTQYLLNFQVKSQLLGAPEYYMEERYSNIIDTFKDTLQKMAKIVADDEGIVVDEDALKQGIEEIVDFDTRIAHIKYKSAQKSVLYHDILDMNFSKLGFLFPAIDWNRYFEEVWPKDIRTYLDYDPEIYIESPDEFFELTKVLLTTDPRILMNYVLMSYVYLRSVTLDDRFDKLTLELSAATTGTKDKKPRDELCTIYIWSLFPLSVDLLYIRNHFDLETKQRVEEMVQQMRNVFDDVIKENKWMDKKTRNYASKKLEKLSVFVGFSPLMNDSARIDKLYNGLELNSHDSFDHILSKLNKYGFNRHFHKLLEKVTSDNTALDASEVNAEYNFRNFATIPAAILQTPVFDPDFPKTFLYAALGSVLAHEFSHAFDQEGSRYDINGNVGKDWWSPETRERFQNRTACFVNQYSDYIIPTAGLHVNGNRTADENIADSGGLKISYVTFKRFVTENPQIPHFEDTSPDQLFFLVYAASECSNERRQAYISDILEDVHTPQPARVNGAVANRAEFAKAFNCKIGTPMNPSKKCEIW